MANIPTETAAEKTSFWDDFQHLLRSPRELWLTYAAIILEYIGLYSFMSTLSLWLSSDFQFSDDRASNWFGVFSAMLSLFAFMIGSVADVVGTRRTLIFSFGTAMLTRSLMSVSTSPLITLPALVAYSFALASGSPVLQTAIHKYSTKRTTAIAFSFFYISLNIGGVLAGYLIDGTKAFFVDAPTHKLVLRSFELPLFGAVTMSAYRAIIGLGTVTAFLAFVCTLFVRPDAHFAAKHQPERTASITEQQTKASGLLQTILRIFRSVLEILRKIFADTAFWRFMLLITLLVLVKSIFVHMHSTWPKYITRERGEDFEWGQLWALNSWLILAFTPIATAFTRHIPRSR